MTTPKVYAAISAVMATMASEGISKDRRNQQQGYSFRGIDDIYNALGRVLADNKLLILPRVIDKEREERATAKGGMLMYTILTVEFDLVSAEDGSHHTIRMIGEAMDSADKSSNKAQSAALKYAALQVFMIPTEGDNDADSSTHAPAPKKASAAADPKPMSEAEKNLWAELAEIKSLRGLQIFWSENAGNIAKMDKHNQSQFIAMKESMKKMLDEANSSVLNAG